VDMLILKFTKTVVESSSFISPEEVKESETHLIEFLDKAHLKSKLQTGMNYTQMWDLLQQTRSHQDWKLLHNKDGISTYVKDNKDVKCWKTEATVLCSHRVANEAIRLMCWERAFFSQTEKIQSFDNSHSDNYFISKFPFPYSNRDWVVKFWDKVDSNMTTHFGYSINVTIILFIRWSEVTSIYVPSLLSNLHKEFSLKLI